MKQIFVFLTLALAVSSVSAQTLTLGLRELPADKLPADVDRQGNSYFKTVDTNVSSTAIEFLNPLGYAVVPARQLNHCMRWNGPPTTRTKVVGVNCDNNKATPEALLYVDAQFREESADEAIPENVARNKKTDKIQAVVRAGATILESVLWRTRHWRWSREIGRAATLADLQLEARRLPEKKAHAIVSVFIPAYGFIEPNKRDAVTGEHGIDRRLGTFRGVQQTRRYVIEMSEDGTVAVFKGEPTQVDGKKAWRFTDVTKSLRNLELGRRPDIQIKSIAFFQVVYDLVSPEVLAARQPPTE